jgi:hypothetical protein
MSGSTAKAGRGSGDDGPEPGLPMSRFQHGDRTAYVGALVIGIGLLFVNIHGLWFAERWSGTTGTLSDVSCAYVGSNGSQHEQCKGIFVTDSGTPVVAQGRNNWVPGARYPAQLSADGRTATAVGTPAVLSAIAGILFALGLAGLGGSGLVLCAIRQHRRDYRDQRVIPLQVQLIPVWWVLPAALAALIVAVIAHRAR